jgi:uncharacterized protein with PIN domain
MARSIECEVERMQNGNIAWITIQVDEALGYGKIERQRLRCLECHGRVKPMSAGPGRVPCAHFEHFRRNKGCSRGDCFDGTRRTHPNPLE